MRNQPGIHGMISEEVKTNSLKKGVRSNPRTPHVDGHEVYSLHAMNYLVRCLRYMPRVEIVHVVSL